MTKIWCEKYRPQKFEDIIGQKHIVERVMAMVKQKNLPHQLYVGPAGVGKTSLILVVAKELYGDSWQDNVLELNASDTRGIDIIRNEVKNFARTKSLTGIPKICILDEADSLTKEAQQDSSKILEPIQSRCAVFRFKPLTKEEITEIINDVADKENLKIGNKTIDVLCEISEGDVRRVYNILQSCSSISKNITEELIYDMVSFANPKEVQKILEIAVAGDFIRSREKLLKTMLESGLSGLDIIRQVQKEIWNLDVKNENKLKLIEKCGEIEFRMVEGSDEFIQLEALLSQFVLLGK
ncbi:AAA family ATPase [Candidatus Woesearchaeota archaeon]|nr:AAA family ATPase [Candidatus Woesearchaeota archaeon]